MGLDYIKPAMNLPVIDEWTEIVRRDRNHPAIIGWCPFNESGDEAGPLQNTVVNVTRAIEPSRPIIDSSGWYHGLPNPDVLDAHDYEENPAKFRATWDDAFASGVLAPQYRGASRIEGPGSVLPQRIRRHRLEHQQGGFGWGSTPKDIEAFYARFKGPTDALLDNPHIFGYCYTQLTDVEQEQNGLYYYNRKPKFDVERLHEIQSRRRPTKRIRRRQLHGPLAATQ